MTLYITRILTTVPLFFTLSLTALAADTFNTTILSRTLYEGHPIDLVYSGGMQSLPDPNAKPGSVYLGHEDTKVAIHIDHIIPISHTIPNLETGGVCTPQTPCNRPRLCHSAFLQSDITRQGAMLSNSNECTGTIKFKPTPDNSEIQCDTSGRCEAQVDYRIWFGQSKYAGRPDRKPLCYAVIGGQTLYNQLCGDLPVDVKGKFKIPFNSNGGIKRYEGTLSTLSHISLNHNEQKTAVKWNSNQGVSLKITYKTNIPDGKGSIQLMTSGGSVLQENAETELKSGDYLVAAGSRPTVGISQGAMEIDATIY